MYNVDFINGTACAAGAMVVSENVWYVLFITIA